MQSRDQTDAKQAATIPPRKAVHDIRNLFATIGAARSLLERDPAPSKRKDLLDAIAEATRQGGLLTTNLLANGSDNVNAVLIDIQERLATLAPMLGVLATIKMRLAGGGHSDHALLARLIPSDFDAVLLELVSNAAHAGASTVTIRGRRCGNSIWLLISDNGCGMSESTLRRARHGGDLGMAHGMGLSRVKEFMAHCGGKLQIRSSVRGGTSFALIFPVLNERKSIPREGSAQLLSFTRQIAPTQTRARSRDFEALCEKPGQHAFRAYSSNGW